MVFQIFFRFYTIYGEQIKKERAVNDDNEVMMITTEGIIIRISCSDISILGRITSGVKLMNLDEKVSVASIAKVREKEDKTEGNEQEEAEEENMESEE